MTPPRWTTLLPAAAYVPLALAVGGGWWRADRAVRAAHRGALRAETALAARLHRETNGPALVTDVIGTRWQFVPGADATWADVSIESTARGPVGVAVVYDQDGWFTQGRIRVTPVSPVARPPPLLIGLALLVLGLLVPTVRWWGQPPPAGTRRLGPAMLAAGLVGLPTAATTAWSVRAMAATTDTHLAVATAALAHLPDLATVIDRPGGLNQFLEVSHLVFDTARAVRSTTLPPNATETLAALPVPVPNRASADRVTYAVADAGPIRIALVPYEHVHHPGAATFGIALVGVLLGALGAFAMRLRRHLRALTSNTVAWGFLAPALIHLAIFTFGPLAFAGWLSLHRWSLLEVARPVVWLDNYRRVLSDGPFWNAILNTTVFTLHVPIAMAVALGLALLAARQRRGRLIFRTLLFLPTVTSLVAVAVVWQWMFNQEYGLFNYVLSLVGVPAVPWLTSPRIALLALMIMSVWLVVGYQVILFQAGLTAIPQTLYDAARIDGAGPWRRFWHVTLPGLRHTLFFVFITSIIGSFQVFGAVYVMTEGGPLDATDVAVFHIYEEAWEFFRFGDAAAMSWVLFAIVFIVTWAHFRMLDRPTESVG